MSGRKREVPLAHPGEILLEEFLRPLGVSMNQLALALRVPNNRINAVVNGKRGISPDTALRLARFFGTTPDFWMNLQSHYDLATVKDLIGEQIEHEVMPRQRAA